MIYGENYILQKGTHILLYGAATTGAILYANLTRAGFCVDAFIDRRADEIHGYYNLPVWDTATAGRCVNPRDTVVAVAIKNVFEHEKVAAELWRAGFRKIIFRPYRAVCGGETEPERLLNLVYNQIMDKNGIEVFSPCPEIEGPERQVLRDQAVILDQGNYVTANIPAPYVFTDKYENKGIIWGDIPCLGLLPHLGLFDVFNGKWNPDYGEYMKYCRQAAEKSGGITLTKAWESSVYQNRLDVFNHMQYSWEHDRNFFTRNAVEGVYNPKGYFNIRSGKHRITYMLTKGSRYIPLKIKKKDYELWREEDKAERIAEILWKNHIETLPVVLANPYFYDYANSSSAFYERVLFSLLTTIYREQFYLGESFRFEGKRLLFSQTPMALYADIFRMLGFEIYICESDSTRMRLNEAVLPAFKCLEDLKNGPSEYDIAVLEGNSGTNNISARIVAAVCEEARNGEEAFLCGWAENKLRYAFLDIYE